MKKLICFLVFLILSSNAFSGWSVSCSVGIPFPIIINPIVQSSVVVYPSPIIIHKPSPIVVCHPIPPPVVIHSIPKPIIIERIVFSSPSCSPIIYVPLRPIVVFRPKFESHNHRHYNDFHYNQHRRR